MVVLLELLVEMKHAWWEVLFTNCIDIFKVKFELAVDFRLVDSWGIHAIDSLVHERLDLILNIVLEKFLGLRSDFKNFLFEIRDVEVLNDFYCCFKICIHKALLNVTLSFFQTNLSVLERNLHVYRLVVTFILIVPVGDSELILLKIFPTDM